MRNSSSLPAFLLECTVHGTVRSSSLTLSEGHNQETSNYTTRPALGRPSRARAARVAADAFRQALRHMEHSFTELALV